MIEKGKNTKKENRLKRLPKRHAGYIKRRPNTKRAHPSNSRKLLTKKRKGTERKEKVKKYKENKKKFKTKKTHTKKDKNKKIHKKTNIKKRKKLKRLPRRHKGFKKRRPNIRKGHL